jgi:hypothetical protein
MRIDANGRIAGPRDKAAPGRASASGRGFSLQAGEGAADSAPVRQAPTVAGLDAMLALQGVEDPLSRRRKALRRGHKLLDTLDGLRLAVLDGTVSLGHLSRLSLLVAEAREDVDDPALESALAEIDVRAAVELAKLQRRMP